MVERHKRQLAAVGTCVERAIGELHFSALAMCDYEPELREELEKAEIGLRGILAAVQVATSAA